MKILIHELNYAPELTATGKYTGEMGEWLARQGHEVRVVAAPPYFPEWRVWEGYSAQKYQRERLAGVDVWRCPLWVPAEPTGLKRALSLASFTTSSFPVMLRQALWRPDVVVAVEPSLFGLPAAWLTARLCAAKSWLHVQDFELDVASGLGMLGKGSTQLILQRIEKLLLRGAMQVSTITESMRRRAVEKGVPEHRTCLFPNWSNIELVRPMPRDDEVRRQFGAGTDDVLILCAGNMGEKQGLELVLNAAEMLRERPEIKFAMVGGGVARERLERSARERGLGNVHFFPVQPLERLPLMLAAGDIHLVVQRREAADLVMPSKLTNILAAGRPSVATAEPGTALYEVLNEYNCGITVPSGDAKELAAGIVALAENTEMRGRLGRNARRYAEAHLDKEKILAEFESKLKKLVQGGK